MVPCDDVNMTLELINTPNDKKSEYWHGLYN